ncbi:hypothetical protein GBA52_010819 [Prunus armeniaca]|nr:hypothetical protein GBA52_010819 [Prunus armeniaca]
MATSSPPPPPPHAVIFPFMTQGHTIPLLDISKALSSRGLKVTVVTTPQNAPFISSKVSDCSSISISVVPFPSVPDLPRGCENATSLPSMELHRSFHRSHQKHETAIRISSEGDGGKWFPPNLRNL